MTSRRLIEGLLLFLLCFVFFTNSHCEKVWGDATRGHATFQDGFLGSYGLRNHHSSGFCLSPPQTLLDPFDPRYVATENTGPASPIARSVNDTSIFIYACEKLSSLKKQNNL